LSARIKREGENGNCDVCGETKSHVFDLEQLATVLRNAIQDNFATGATRYVPNDSDRNEYEPYGDSLETVVAEVLGQDLENFEELVEAIVEGEDYRPQDGEESFFGNGDLYVRVKRRETAAYFSSHWRHLIDELKHRRRFFSEEVRDFFDGLFKNVETLKTWELDVFNQVGSVVQEHAQGMVVFRARKIEEWEFTDVCEDPFAKVGPPPRSKAGSGRMSPEGVVALYCAMDQETALAELRPAIGEVTAVIGLAFTRKLRLLNMERLERSLDEGLGEILDENFDTNESTRNFLRKLHSLVSLPVVPGKESEYLITQAMAEYLAHVYVPKLDGIVFKSVQCAGGMNIVLFAEQNPIEALRDEFPVEYSPDTLTFHRTQQVKYKHAKLLIHTSPEHGTKLYADGDFDDEQDTDIEKQWMFERFLSQHR
jgi:hypothetical protein